MRCASFISNGARFDQARYLYPLLALYGAILALAARVGGRRVGPVIGAAIVAIAIFHDVFAQLLTVPLFHEHRILCQVAGHRMNVVKALPALVVSEDDVRWFAAAVRLRDGTSVSLREACAPARFGGSCILRLDLLAAGMLGCGLMTRARHLLAATALFRRERLRHEFVSADWQLATLTPVPTSRIVELLGVDVAL